LLQSSLNPTFTLRVDKIHFSNSLSMNYKCTVLALLLLGTGCNGNEQEFEELVASKNGTFWTIRLPNEKEAYSGYKFFPKGSCYYCLIARDGRVVKYDGGDNIAPNRWEKYADTLVLNAVKTNILHLSQDSIVLYYPKPKQTAILIRSDKRTFPDKW
jgi:hypothetical protein